MGIRYKVRSTTLPLALLMLLISGCGADSNDSMDAVSRAADSFTGQFCQCYADQLYSGDIATCQEAEVRFNMKLNSDCQRNVTECYATEFRQFTSCLARAFSNLEACYASCPEEQQHFTCQSEFETDAGDCYLGLPRGFFEGISTCVEGNDFVCFEQ